MYTLLPIDPDPAFPDFLAEVGDWFNVEGDLDDFIFFDPTGFLPEPSSK